MRTIDADGLKRKVQKEATESWKMKIKASVETILNQVIDWIDEAQTVEQEQQWIPVKYRPMDDEERKDYEETFGPLADDEAVMFDCKMPQDGQEVWVCSKCGNVWQDTCQIDEGIYLEENGDWLDIVAWMPYIRPEPWEGEEKP